MQKTTHWDLNTWAGSDPVSLDQMNENFTKITAIFDFTHLVQDECKGIFAEFHKNISS